MNFTVAKLAERWECSRTAVYALIRSGKIRTFSIGDPERDGNERRRMSGLRITLEEVERWEGRDKPTDPETAPSDDGETSGSPTSRQMKHLASVPG